MDWKDHRVSPYSLVFVASIMACSQIWLPWLSEHYLEWTQGYKVDHKESGEGIWVRDIAQVSPLDRSSQGGLDQSLERELRAKIYDLEKTLRQARVTQKQLGQDLRLLKVNTLGEVLRRGHEVAVIDAGLDFGVGEKDWVIAGRDVVGQVVSVSESCALIESYTQSEVNTFVQIEGLQGEYLWEGQGQSRAIVYVKGNLSGEVLNRQVYLSGAGSREGMLRLGEIEGLQKDQEGGWWKLIVKGRKIQVDDILFVVQRIDPAMSQLFGNRDTIAELTQRLRRMELDKLRMELTKD